MLVEKSVVFLPISPQKRLRRDRIAKRAIDGAMKLVLEFLIALILHPIAVVLMWIDLAGREDLAAAQKAIWAIVGLVWGIGPILYMLVGDGELW